MKQLKKFDIRKMGHKKGMCLQNVRLGFGIGKKFYHDDKLLFKGEYLKRKDMEWQGIQQKR